MFDDRATAEIALTKSIAKPAGGLVQVREQRYEEGSGQLKRAYELEPGNARVAYVYAVALDSLGMVDDAVAVVETARAEFPEDAEIQSLWQLLQQ